MNRAENWKPFETDGEYSCHREPGEEFLFYRAVAAGLIDAVQENCSRGAFENMEGAGLFALFGFTARSIRADKQGAGQQRPSGTGSARLKSFLDKRGIM